MGINDFWTDALGDWMSVCKHEKLSNYAGQRIAIDLSIIINKSLRTDIDRLSATCNPTYKCKDLLQNIIVEHEVLTKTGILPVYVYDGMSPEEKKKEKERRRALLEKAGDKYIELRQQAIDNINAVEPIQFSAEQLKEATESRMKSGKPTPNDQTNILQWMKKQGLECYGSLLEADQQMVALEQDGIVDGIMSEDGDTIANGGKVVYCKLSRKGGYLTCKVFKRDDFMKDCNTYNSKLCTYPELMVDVALLLGNDYMSRIRNNGPVMVLGKYANNEAAEESRRRGNTRGRRQEDGLIDRLANADDKVTFINTLGNNGKRALTEQQRTQYWEARKYMLHAPVIRKNRDTNELYIGPLNDLPAGDGTDWIAYLGSSCGLELVMSDDNLLNDIYNCNILPLTRKPFDCYDGPHNEDGTNAEWFQVLDFNKDPIPIQPTLCLVNWCRARGVDVHPTRSSREYIEQCTRNFIRVNKPLSDDPLTPITGAHDGYRLIKNRIARNDRDTWNNNFVEQMHNIKTMNDKVLKHYLDSGNRADRPSLHERVKRLVESGSYSIKSISCRNVESIDEDTNGSKCILFRFDCLSSRTKVIHQVYAVFEDKKDGEYMIKLSSCSCKKGQYFCSHLIGFLHIIGIVQTHKINSEKELERLYPTKPELIYKEPIRIELNILKDMHRREEAQSKRQSKRQRTS